MKNTNFFQKIYPCCFSVLFLGMAYFLNVNNEKPLMFVPKQTQSLNFNSSLFNYCNLGLKRLISSALWISTIIESDIDHYKQKDLNSWMFLRFNSISELEPLFYENYAFGGVYLSIIKDDIPGSTIIFNKGISKYPFRYPLLRDASYHFFFEAKNYNRAYELTQIIKKKFPQKIALMGMTTKLEAENGKLEEALATLDEYQKSYPRGDIIGEKIFQNRYALKAEIDLNCLNKAGNENCNRIDLNGLPYLKNKNGYIAQTEWKPYRRKSLIEKK
jgi:hypothetical protein